MVDERRLLKSRPGNKALSFGQSVPKLIAAEGPEATKRFLEFFTANIRNKNTRMAYAQAVGQFCQWCDCRRFSLILIEPTTVAAYIEDLSKTHSKPTVKQHLSAVRMLFDWLVLGQICPANPASVVRGPKHVVKRGKTPVLSAEDARTLLDSIDVSTLIGLRDRALIGTMVYSFARVSAAVGMRVQDYYQNGKRSWLRLHEKGGRFHEVPAHHNAEAYLDAYLRAAGIGAMKSSPLFRSLRGKTGILTENQMSRTDALKMIKCRARKVGLAASTCCHTFRGTGITAFIENGGTIENAQAIAGHESPRTTKLYDRTQDEITLDEVERIRI